MPLVLLGLAALVLVLLRSWFRSPSRIGSTGEARVDRRLRSLPDDEYIPVRDLLIPTSHGTSQIDHVVVARCGVFVIETKSMSGWIHGHERSEYWTQTIYHDRFRFRNPVKQNWAHIYALKEVLRSFSPLTFHPIVVFAGSAELKNVTSRTPVIYASELRQQIARTCVQSELTVDQMHAVARRLKEANLEGSEVRKDHRTLVRGRVDEHRRKEQDRTCPKCGGRLVPRSGPYGHFFGCSNYPRCKYTLNNFR